MSLFLNPSDFGLLGKVKLFNIIYKAFLALATVLFSGLSFHYPRLSIKSLFYFCKYCTCLGFHLIFGLEDPENCLRQFFHVCKI